MPFLESTSHLPSLINSAFPLQFRLKYLCEDCEMRCTVPVDMLGTFTTIPTLNLPNGTHHRVAHIGDLLTEFLLADHIVPCDGCQGRRTANIIAEKGIFTILTINRTYYYDREGKIHIIRFCRG